MPLPKRFPAQLAKPIAPFVVAAIVRAFDTIVVTYGINSLQNAMMNSARETLDVRRTAKTEDEKIYDTMDRDCALYLVTGWEEYDRGL
ncbi:hypothetical protein FQN57_001722 [Myotisia sp. PD_48]|nr:hypothetical protein FQN57_001722 [Myotisia sp. PD_48]